MRTTRQGGGGVAEDTAGDTAPVTQRAAHSPLLRHTARLGLLGYALIHLLVAWLALQLAWGPGRARTAGRSADSAGALDVLAESPFGDGLLWALAASLAGLCAWQAVEVLRHHRSVPGPGPRRRAALVQLVKTVGTAVLYGFLAVSAVRAALGLRAGRREEQETVRGVLSWPGGQLLVVAVVGWAAATFDAATATGLDGALRAVATGPLGPVLLTVVATGLATFSVYLLARARHPVG
ncbi:protein of unknown function [Geodermatophilus dictyosporus]|uniref:DUF1206 domain-containing protein n=1 Tax=Geodermatophilus dictyosporus TaxID=1523247 RepID=A0A1I5U4U7_9ACTN|nr:DUF1206 domain-containing protein [Geodermatophilus dictyosporus]SFP90280.1 protein of unknown function [Geodermatophilus dictyosporus]